MTISPEQEQRLDALFRLPQLKKFLVIEIPSDIEPRTLVTIGQLVETASKLLQEIGVDPVRTTFLHAKTIEAINGGM